MATIKIKVGDLLRIAKKSKGYEITLASGETLSNFRQYKRGYVECDINGKANAGVYDKETILTILD